MTSKTAIVIIAMALASTAAHAETQVYQRHCTESDYFQPGMT